MKNAMQIGEWSSPLL